VAEAANDPPRTSRTPLRRDRILRAAVSLADAEGLEALTMRALAGALQVEAMSLYNHVDNKDDLLDGMVDLVASEIEEPADDADWRTATRRRAVSAHAALLRHRWAPLLWASRMQVGPARMRHLDGLLRGLREGGFPPGLLDVGFHTLQNHIVGHALQHVSFPFDAADLPALSARYLADFPAERYPDLAGHIRHHLEEVDGEVSSFAFGLDAILDALERARDDGRRGPDGDRGPDR
jgi:AcrR family transcriptional regulator